MGKHLSDTFPNKNIVKQGDALSPLFFKCALEYYFGKAEENQEELKLIGTHSFWSVVMILIW
jgi:hypothetical protein